MDAWTDIDNVLRGNTPAACVKALLRAVWCSFDVVGDNEGFNNFCYSKLMPVLHKTLADRASTMDVLAELRNALHGQGRGNALPWPPQGAAGRSVQPPRSALTWQRGHVFPFPPQPRARAWPTPHPGEWQAHPVVWSPDVVQRPPGPSLEDDDPRDVDPYPEEDNDEVSAEEQCIVCFDKRRRVMFKPCNHIICCYACASKYQREKGKCPKCIQPTTGFETVNRDVVKRAAAGDETLKVNNRRAFGTELRADAGRGRADLEELLRRLRAH